jgi:hypothetical protein
MTLPHLSGLPSYMTEKPSSIMADPYTFLYPLLTNSGKASNDLSSTPTT